MAPRGPVAQDMARRVQAQQMRRFPRTPAIAASGMAAAPFPVKGCLAYHYGKSMMMYMKGTKLYSLPVNVIECRARETDEFGVLRQQCLISADPSSQAPDGIDRWVTRCSSYDQPSITMG